MSRLIPKTGLALGIAMVLLLTSLFPVLGDTLNDKLKQNQQQQQQTKQQISKYQDEEENVLQAIEDTQSKMSESQSKLTQLNTQLSMADTQLQQAERDLSAAEGKLGLRTEALNKRLRGIYQEGEFSYLQVLVQADSLSDFVNRLEYVRRIIYNDQRLLKEINDQKTEIAAQKTSLLTKRDAVAAVKSQQEQEQSLLEQEQNNYQAQLQKKQDMLDQLTKELSISEAEEQQIQQQISNVIRNSAPQQGSRPGALIWPAPSVHSISSKFGWRYHPVLHVNKLHTGIDIPVSMGSQVIAAADGQVIWAGLMNGYGYTIIISHGGGMQTLYGHLSEYRVRAGDTVKGGQTIALSGGAAGHPGAGYSTGAHLHFEVRINGTPENPLNYL